MVDCAPCRVELQTQPTKPKFKSKDKGRPGSFEWALNSRTVLIGPLEREGEEGCCENRPGMRGQHSRPCFRCQREGKAQLSQKGFDFLYPKVTAECSSVRRMCYREGSTIQSCRIGACYVPSAVLQHSRHWAALALYCARACLSGHVDQTKSPLHTGWMEYGSQFCRKAPQPLAAIRRVRAHTVRHRQGIRPQQTCHCCSCCCWHCALHHHNTNI